MHTVRLYSRKAPAIQGGRLLTVHLIHGHCLSSALGKLPWQERSHPHKGMYMRDHSDAATTQLINQIPGEQCTTGHIQEPPNCNACTEAVTRIGDVETSLNSLKQISAQQGISRLTALRYTLIRQLQQSKRDYLCTAAGAGDRRDSLVTNDAHSLYHCLTWRAYTQTGAVHAAY